MDLLTTEASGVELGQAIKGCASQCLNQCGSKYPGTIDATTCRYVGWNAENARFYKLVNCFFDQPCEASTYNYCRELNYLEMYQYQDPD